MISVGSRRLLWLHLTLIFIIECNNAEGFCVHSAIGVTVPYNLKPAVLTRPKRSSRRKRESSLSHATDDGPTISITLSDAEESVPKTVSEAVNRFFFGADRGPIAAVATIMGLLWWRIAVAMIDLLAFGIGDILVSVTSVAFWCFQEHFMHQNMLHSKVNWMGKEIHQGHHDKPYFHISIDPASLMIGWLVTAHVCFRLILPLDLALSASIGYAGAGLMYEWAHYIAHTKVKPPNAFWKKVRDNHIKHHLVDSRYWFAFSLPAMDDWFDTNPPLEHVKMSRTRKTVCSRDPLVQQTGIESAGHY